MENRRASKIYLRGRGSESSSNSSSLNECEVIAKEIIGIQKAQKNGVEKATLVVGPGLPHIYEQPLQQTH